MAESKKCPKCGGEIALDEGDHDMPPSYYCRTKGCDYTEPCGHEEKVV